MPKLNIPASLFFLGILVAAGLPNATAHWGSWDTYVTFSGPVEIPGMVLAPGKYEFKLMESGKRDDYIGIFNMKGDLMETLFGTPEYRRHTTDTTVLTMEKRGPRDPEAIESWFYPDSNYGIKFVYPKPAGSGVARKK